MEPTKRSLIDQQNELHLLCYAPVNQQDELNAALRSLNVEGFRSALQKGADPDQLSPDGDGGLSVFELCCQRPGHAELIVQCLQWGRCQVNRVNPKLGASPVHLAAESEDAANVAALLGNASVRLDPLYEGKTPLSQLTADLNDANFEARFACIELLVRHQANVNVGDERGVPPILSVLKSRRLAVKNKRRVVDFLLSEAIGVDVDTHWDGQARQLIEKGTDYDGISLPAAVPEADRLWTDARLMDCLRSGDRDGEERFVRGCDALPAEKLASFLRATDEISEVNGTNPMQVAIDNGLTRAVEKMLRCGAAIRLVEEANRTTFDALHRACHFGHSQIVGLLLSSAQPGEALVVSASDALAVAISHCGGNDMCSDEYQRCFDRLINVTGIDINRQNALGNTALHLAVQYKQQSIVRELLRRGANMGVRNASGQVAIADIDPDVLAAHFDECVLTSPDRRAGDDEFEWRLRYANFTPIDERKDLSLSSFERLRQTRTNPRNTELAPIKHIVADRDLRHLAQHPLIASFLFLKWQRVAPAFYVNFVCFAVFCASLITMLVCRNANVEYGSLRPLLGLLVCCGIVYMLVRELIIFLVAPVYTLRSKDTYATLVLVLLTAVLLAEEFGSSEQNDAGSGRHSTVLSEETRRSLAACAILLSFAQLFVLLGSLPVMSFSTHLVMFWTVSLNFLRSLLLYSIMLVAFAFCFCTLMGRDVQPTQNSAAADVDEDDDQFNKFASPGLAMVKTVVMLTGEFDAGSIEFAYNSFSYAVFVVFVFLISTVLLNLLNGLAINDTQEIKAEAELTELIYRAKLLAKYEEILGRDSRGECKRNLMKSLLSRRITLIPDLLPLAEIRILPNVQNRVQIPQPLRATANDDKEAGPTPTDGDLQVFSGHWQHLACCFGFARCNSMEPKIAKRIRALLERRQQTANEATVARERDAQLEQRLQRIEKSVDMVMTRLDSVLTSLMKTTTK